MSDKDIKENKLSESDLGCKTQQRFEQPGFSVLHRGDRRGFLH